MAFKQNIYELQNAQAIRAQQEAQRQAEEQQRQAYERALKAQSEAQQAQNKQTNPLEAVLSGIANSIKNVGDTLYNMGGTGIAAIRDAGESIFGGKGVTTKNQDDWKNYLKKTQYGDENMSDKDYYLKTGGKGVDAAATVSDLIPGLGKGARVALNVGQGIASGAVNPIIEYGSQANLEDILKGAAVGGAGAGVGQYVGGKLASKAGSGRLGKMASSTIGRGALTGAASGAVAGGLNAGLNGGNVFEGALQGAQRGGIGGGVMAGVMGAGNRAAQKVNNRLMQPKGGANVPTATPDVTDNVVNKTTQEMAQDMATTPTRRNIPITDYDNGEVPIRVRGANQGNRYSLGKGQGSNIDGILAPDNVRQLPNAQKPNPTIGEYMLGDKAVTNAYDAIPRLIDETWGDTFNKNAYDDMLSDLDAPTRAKLTESIRDMASLNNMTDGETNLTSKSQLPKIKTSDYTEATGYKGKDIPDYMRPYLAKDGLSLKDGAWAQYMPKYSDGGTFTGTPDDILGVYDRLAGTNQNNIYTADNIGMALKMDPELNQAVTEQMLKAGYNTRNIPVKGAPSIADTIDVTSNTGEAPIRTTKRTLNANKPNTPITYSDADEPITIVDTKRNPNLSAKDQAKYERQYITAKKAQGQALLDQYGTIDTPTSRSVRNAGKVLTDLYDNYGLESPADVQYVASRLTGKDGLVTQMTRKLAGTAGDILGTYDEKVLDDLITGEGFSTKERANAVKNQVKQIIGSMNMSGPESANALDVLDMTKKLYDKRAQVLGEDGTYHRATYDDRATARVLKAVAEDYNDRIWENSDISKVLTPENIEVIKSIYPENAKFIEGVDNVIAKATNGRELRSTMANFVKAQDIIDNANQIAGTTGAQMARTGVMRGPVKAVAQTLAQKTLNSEGAQRIKANMAARKAAQAEAILNNTEMPQGKTNAVKGIAGEVAGGVKNIAQKTGRKIGNAISVANTELPEGNWGNLKAATPMDMNDIRNLPGINANAAARGLVGLNNMVNNQNVATGAIARQAALDQTRTQNNTRDYNNAQMDMQNALQDYSNASNQVLQAQNNIENARAQVGTSNGMGTLNTISQALDRALAAGDLEAYTQLANLYKQAYSIYEMQNPTATTTATEAKEPTQNQTKALTGLQQLQTLSSMSPTVATALSNTPLNGLVDLFGGDDYYNNAQSLALTLGYLQSGANITPREAEKIGQAYVPTAFDSEAVRQSKLSRAEQLLRNYLGNYTAQY